MSPKVVSESTRNENTIRKTNIFNKHSQLIAFAFVITITICLLWYYHNRFWHPEDDGNYAHVAERILAGEVLNGSIQDLHMGYINFANALALFIFGNDMVSLRYPLVLLTLIQVGLVFYLFFSCRYPIIVTSIASLAYVCLTFIQFLNPTANWYCLFLFMTVVMVLQFYPNNKPGQLVLLGFLLATLFLFRQLTGVIVGIGVITFLLLKASDSSKDNRQWLGRSVVLIMVSGLLMYLWTKSSWLAFCLFGIWPSTLLVWVFFNTSVPNKKLSTMLFQVIVGILIGLAPILLYHVSHGSLISWLDDTLAAALRLTELPYFKAQTYALYLVAGLQQVLAPRNLAEWLNGFFWLFLPLVGFLYGILFFWLLNREEKFRAILLQPLPFLAVFYGLVSIHYEHYGYLFFTLCVLFAAVLWLTKCAPWRWYSLLAILFILFMSSVGLYYHAGQPYLRGNGKTQPYSTWGILKGQKGQLIQAKGLERCTLWIHPTELVLYKQLINTIETHVSENESIFAIPSSSTLYFLSKRNNPFRFYNTAFGVRDKSTLQKVLQLIKNNPPRLIFFQPEDVYNTQESLAIMEVVKQQYMLLERIGDFEIYKLTKTHQNRGLLEQSN